MNDLVKVNFDTQTVSARELHEQLHIGTRFNDWFPRMCEYGFEEGKEYYSKMSKTASQIWEANLMRAYRVNKNEGAKLDPMQ